MRKTEKRILNVLLIVVPIILLDTIQAFIFDNSPILKIREYYDGGDLYYKDKGLLVDTYCGMNGKKDTVIKGFSYSVSEDAYDEAYKGVSE